jgi:hypothetical protein
VVVGSPLHHLRSSRETMVLGSPTSGGAGTGFVHSSIRVRERTTSVASCTDSEDSPTLQTGATPNANANANAAQSEVTGRTSTSSRSRQAQQTGSDTFSSDAEAEDQLVVGKVN